MSRQISSYAFRPAAWQLLLCCAFCCAAQLPEAAGASGTVRSMAVLNSRYELRAGEPVQVSAPRETVDFLVRATKRGAAIEGAEEAGFVVAPNEGRDQILLAASPKTRPGTYNVTLSAASESGEDRQTTVQVTVKPMAAVPAGTARPPVVLLNGWQTGITGSCPISASSASTFGNLAQYLLADGAPAVYLFDNCSVDPGQSIEILAQDLGAFLNSIKYSDGTQVPQIDLVTHSMGGLIARAYLEGLQPDQTYAPPVNTLVRKLILIATPNFGSYVAANYASNGTGTTQITELVPGSAFLWNVSTWNQNGDDLRGVDILAIAGNAGTYSSTLSSGVTLPNASDGLVSITSASIGFVSQKPVLTRIVPYCHVDQAAFTNPSLGTFNCTAPGIANITDTNHATGQIVRLFLADNSAWNTIGNTPATDPYLRVDAGMYFAVKAANGTFVSDITQVTWGTVAFQAGGSTGTIFYGDFLSGTGAFTAISSAVKNIGCGNLASAAGYFTQVRCKIGPAIISVTPWSSAAAGRAVAAGTTVMLTGGGLGSQCGSCQVAATAAGSTTAKVLTVASWQNSAISVNLPADMSGFYTVKVTASGGMDTIGIMVTGSTSIVADPTSLQFSYTSGGASPDSQAIQISNGGTGTLVWTATTSAPWLSLSGASGTGSGTLTVSASPSGLSAGTYTGTVDISAPAASNNVLSIGVTLTVAEAPAALVVSPQALAFQYTVGSAMPAAQDISIANGGGSALTWSASSSAFWATLSATSGAAPATLSVAVNPANLAAGTYTTTIPVAASDGGKTPAAVTVTLEVKGTQPAGTITAAVNAGSFQPGITSGGWVSIFGTNLSQRTYTWQGSDIVDGKLPAALQGVSITINGLPAYVDYISPGQINVLAPDDPTLGTVQVQVTTAGQPSNTLSVQKSKFAPALLTLNGTYVAALHTDYTLVAAPDLFPGVVTTAAKAGETLLLYGAGFGATNPAQPSGQVVASAAPLANEVQVSIGGVAATVTYAGLVQAGLYQFNVTVPALPKGDAAVTATIGGVPTQTGVLLTVQ